MWVPAATAHGVSTVSHWMLPSPKQLSFKLSLKWSQYFLVTPTVFLPFELWGQTLSLKVLQNHFIASVVYFSIQCWENDQKLWCSRFIWKNNKTRTGWVVSTCMSTLLMMKQKTEGYTNSENLNPERFLDPREQNAWVCLVVHLTQLD